MHNNVGTILLDNEPIGGIVSFKLSISSVYGPHEGNGWKGTAKIKFKNEGVQMWLMRKQTTLIFELCHSSGMVAHGIAGIGTTDEPNSLERDVAFTGLGELFIFISH